MILGLFCTQVYAGYKITGMGKNKADFGSALYRASFTDLVANIQGGGLPITRAWVDDHWEFITYWSNLKFIKEESYTQSNRTKTFATNSGGGNTNTNYITGSNASNSEVGKKIVQIKIGVFEYDLVNGGEEGKEIYTFKNKSFITKTETGYLWTDRHKNWQKYNEAGQLLESGNSNTLIAKFVRDQQGRIEHINDIYDQTALTITYNENGKIWKITDYKGRIIEYIWNGSNLESFIDVMGNEWKYQYEDLLGNRLMRKIITPENMEVNINHTAVSSGTSCYSTNRKVGEGGFLATTNANKSTGGNSIGRVCVNVPDSVVLSSITDSSGKGVSYDYFYDGNKKQYTLIEKYPNNMRKETIYNLEGEAREQYFNGVLVGKVKNSGNTYYVEDGGGNKTVVEYDDFGELIKITYPDNTSERNSYNHLSKITSHIDQENVETRFKYDEFGNLTDIIEAVGLPLERTTKYKYDQYGNVTEIKYVGDSNTAEAVYKYTYDNRDNILTYEDAEGNITTFSDYDANGDPWTITDARGKTWKYEYNKMGRLKKITSPMNFEVNYTYDKLGRLIAHEDEVKSRHEFTYNPQSLLKKIIDPLKNERKYEYNLNDRLEKITDESNKTVTNEYDSFGRLKTVRDGYGNGLNFSYGGKENNAALFSVSEVKFQNFTRDIYYDSMRRVTKMVDDISGEKTTYMELEYTTAGRIKKATDSQGKETRFYSDAFGRITKVEDANGKYVEFTYDNRNNVLAITDPEFKTTRFEYDKNDRPIKEIRPMLQEYSVKYNEVGNLVEEKDPKGNIKTSEYDDDNRLIKEKQYAAANLNAPEKEIDYEYYNDSLLKSYSDGESSASYVYTELGQLSSESITYNLGKPEEFTKTYSYTYYENGGLKTYTDPEGKTQTYEYDLNDQIKRIIIPEVGSIVVPERHFDSEKKVIYPGGTTVENTFNERMYLKRSIVRDPAKNIITDRTYNYDSEINITNINTEYGDYIYTYDDVYRLTDVTAPGNKTESFKYDGNSNIITANNETEEWQYNANHELQANRNITYEYDLNGSLTKKTEAGISTYYKYNANNRLVKVEDNDHNTIAEYSYDPFGRRISKKTGAETTYFIYTLEGLAGEYNANAELIRGYGYSPNTIWMTSPIYQKTANNYYFYLNDFRGAPERLITTSGQTVWEARYSAYGEITVLKNIVENPLRMAGQYEDKETGLYYNRFRYYDPKIGRYLSVDPLEIFLSGTNPYAYTSGNPISYIDPYGLSQKSAEQMADEWMEWLFWTLIIHGGDLGDLLWGVADGLTFGYAEDVRNLFGIKGPNKCSLLYALGDMGSMLIPVGGALKGIKYLRRAKKAKNAGKAARRARGARGKGRGGKPHKGKPEKINCFTEGTLISTSNGLTPIEKIRVGDLVYTRDSTTGEITLERVVALFITENMTVVDVHLLSEDGNEETITATDGHPFYVIGKGWMNAANLEEDDIVLSLDNRQVKVVQVEEVEKQQTVYNFEVENKHNYFVGKSKALVHNVGDCNKKKGPKPNNGVAKKHGNTNHNNAIDNRITELKQDTGVTNIRKNQQQVDVDGNKVGTNRPDIQFDKDGCHNCIEYDHVERNSVKHGEVIRQKDSKAKVELNRL